MQIFSIHNAARSFEVPATLHTKTLFQYPVDSLQFAGKKEDPPTRVSRERQTRAAEAVRRGRDSDRAARDANALRAWDEEEDKRNR